MINPVRNLFRKSASPRRDQRRRRPGLEALESRDLLAIFGSSFPVNGTTASLQYSSDNASSADGRSVVVWLHQYSPTDNDIRAQLYNSSGQKTGPELSIESSGADETDPAVAMDDNGNFVVTYSRLVGGQSDVVARRFSSTGVQVGGTITVAGTARNEFGADVAADRYGNFAVSYTRRISNYDTDVVASWYDSAGNPVGAVVVAASDKNESDSSVAMSPNGGTFAVAYQYQYGSGDNDIYLTRYNTGGISIGSHSIATSVDDEREPDVSMDDAGNAVVAYMRRVGGDYDIKARRLSPGGTLGGEITIANTVDNEWSPKVALARTGGRFVVAYTTYYYSAHPALSVAEVSAGNTILARHNLGSSTLSGAAVSIDAQGYYFVSYATTGSDIRGRLGYV